MLPPPPASSANLNSSQIQGTLMGISQISNTEESRSVKKPCLTVSLPLSKSMLPRPKPDKYVLDIFGEMEFRERHLGTSTPSPLPSPFPSTSPTPLLHSDDEISEEEIAEVEESESDHENIETCGRRACLRCNKLVLGSRVLGAEFPAPISSIGRNGKLRVYYISIKENGRFVLKEVRMPGQQCMHASRENGRLLLQLGNPDSLLDDDSEYV